LWWVKARSPKRRFLELMLPYCRFKQSEMQLALRLMDLIETDNFSKAKPMTDGALVERTALFEACRQLKNTKYTITT
jgi:hypothetical protein